MHQEITLNTVNLWLTLGTIKLSSVGDENIYFTDEFNHSYFYKIESLRDYETIIRHMTN